MQTSFYDLEERYASLSHAGDPLERLNAVIDWELFRPLLSRLDNKPRKSNAGRKPLDRVLMFKLLILQRLHNVSDEQLQYQVTDRLSFMRFLGLDLAADVPDARTVWAFREQLRTQALVEPLFECLHEALGALGVALKSGQIVDATFVPIPIQRNSREDNALIKANAVPIEWSDKPAMRQQKDIDARWTKKNGQNHYGYKNHINIDRSTKLITRGVCTAAHVHDSQAFAEVLRSAQEGGEQVWADSAYRSQEQEQALPVSGHDSQINERAYKDQPLSEAQTQSNRSKSSVRSRVEHIFATMENECGGIFLRCIGLARAKVGAGLMNLTYNLKRIEVLIRQRVFAFDRVIASAARQMA
jgi:IS5 family transposase